MKVHKLLACYSYFCKQSVFDGAINKLECLRTTGPLFRTYEPSDYRTFITESRKSRYRTYEPSDCRTFGIMNPLFRTHEPSDYRTFGLESSHHLWHLHHYEFSTDKSNPCRIKLLVSISHRERETSLFATR